YISPRNEQTAILVADALRYEMGMELFGLIEDKISKNILPMISTVPTITEFGMAELLPNGGAKLNVGNDKDNFKISDGNFNMPLNNKQERIKYFIQQAGTLGLVKNLNEVVDEPNNSLKTMFEGKSRILIYSSEIDEAGHIEDTSIQLFPTLINKINVSINKLLDIGIERILIVADHGFLLTSGLDDWMKIDIQKDMDCVSKKRRFSISKNKIEGNYITKASLSVNHNGNLYFNFPRGINVFSAAGGSKFLHGGISIQELLIPIIEINNVKATKNTWKHEPVEYKIQSLDIDSLFADQKETSKSIQQQLISYIDNNEVSKKEKKVLELFMKSRQYKDAEIQEICAKDKIKFMNESVMKFMEKFISKLQAQGYDWIGMRVVGLSTIEYYLKEEE
ncbi:MAG: PglZ domain-containing protein, partial [Clostridium butyricum]|nr:PglZ domain-containing protein [Clostridium butyricum]